MISTETEDAVKDFLHRFIAPWTTGDSPWGDAPFTSPETTKNFFSNFLKKVLLTVEGRYQLIAVAKAGYGPAIDVLRRVLMEHKSRGVLAAPLPIELAEYDLWLTVNGEPRRERDAGKLRHFTRDIVIALAVGGVLYHFPQIKLQGRSTRTKSADCLVAEALRKFGLGRSARQVRRAYESWPDGFKIMFKKSL
jgi:hypothetical protein